MKRKNKKSLIEKTNIHPFFNSNTFIYILLGIIIILSFYIRGIIPYEATFRTSATGFAIDDAVYHMRLVENLIANYPYRLTYDPFTQYPYGSVLSWGSMFTLIIGTLALIFGVDKLNFIAAYVPVIMGVLVVIPVYFIGKEIYNKKAGFIAALLIAIIPGQFLQRTTLGFTDNHAAEVLFSTLFIMFLIFAFNRKDNIKKNSVFAGISLGLYILSWSTGILFAGIIGIVLLLQIIINYSKNISNTSLLLITTIIYTIAAVMVIPVIDVRNGFSNVYYSFMHIIVLLSVIIMCYLMDKLSLKCRNLKLKIHKFVSIIIIIFISIILSIRLFIPKLYNIVGESFNIMFVAKTGGAATIAEGMSTNISQVLDMYGINFLFALISIFLIILFHKNDKKEDRVIILVWSTILFFMLLAQNRWSYYFTINIVILSGCFYAIMLDYVAKFKDIKIINIWNIFIIFAVIIFVVFYPFNSSYYVQSSQTTKNGVLGEGFYEWYETLTWMRNNTPDTGLDYYGRYERPFDNTPYPYPETAYGVMSWWDYGHMVTYWAHRIPNANPFQSGIGSSYKAGAAPFFISKNEDDSIKILKELGINGNLGAKYIVTNNYMAYAIQPVMAEWIGDNFDYYIAIKTSSGNAVIPTSKYYTTMESKLHILDGNGLKYYRLVHESNPNPYTKGGSVEMVYKQVYNDFYVKDQNHKIPPEISGYVKIFEIVKGANVKGKTIPNTEVKVENIIITNIGRGFRYSQNTISDKDGNYNFTLPYSTSGSINGETQFDTKATDKYKITINSEIKELDITEYQVLSGDTVII